MMLGGLGDGCGELTPRPPWSEWHHSGNYLQHAGAGGSVGTTAALSHRGESHKEYLAPRLGHPEAVWVFSDFPKQGRKSAVLRQAGQGGQLPGWDVPGLRQPAGPGVGGQAAVSAQELDLRPGPVCCGGCAGGPAELPVKDGVGPGDAGAVLELGYLRAEWVAGDDAFGMSPTFREGLAALMRYVLDVPGGTTVWPLDPAYQSGISGVRPPPQTQAAAWAAADHGAVR